MVSSGAFARIAPACTAVQSRPSWDDLHPLLQTNAGLGRVATGLSYPDTVPDVSPRPSRQWMIRSRWRGRAQAP